MWYGYVAPQSKKPFRKNFFVRTGRRTSCGVIATSTERRNGCSQKPIDGTRSRLEIEQSRKTFVGSNLTPFRLCLSGLAGYHYLTPLSSRHIHPSHSR